MTDAAVIDRREVSAVVADVLLPGLLGSFLILIL